MQEMAHPATTHEHLSTNQCSVSDVVVVLFMGFQICDAEWPSLGKIRWPIRQNLIGDGTKHLDYTA
jgi:hypothetical protein